MSLRCPNRARLGRSCGLVGSPLSSTLAISAPRRAASATPTPPPPPRPRHKYSKKREIVSTTNPLETNRPPPDALERAGQLANQYLPNLTALVRAIRHRDKKKLIPPQVRENRPKAPSVRFRDALKAGRFHGLGPAYLESMAMADEEGDPPSISADEVRAAIQLLSRSRDEHQWTTIDTMVDDLTFRYSSPPTHLDYRALLRFLASSPTPRAAFPRLETIPLSIAINIIDFNIVLRGLANAADEPALRSAMDQLPALDLTPDRTTFHIFLRGLFLARAHAGDPAYAYPAEGSPPLPSSSAVSTETAPLAADVEATLAKMANYRLPASSATYSILADGYRRLGDKANTARALDLVRSTLSGEMNVVKVSKDGNDILGVVPWNSLVEDAAIEHNLEAGVAVVERMRQEGIEPDEGTIDALLHGVSVRKLGDVLDVARLLEAETNVELFARHWGRLIVQVLYPDGGVPTKSSMEEALRIYNEATLKRGILVDTDMAIPLLEAFCYPAPGEQPNIDRSMDIYQDLLRSEALLQVNALSDGATTPSPSTDAPVAATDADTDTVDSASPESESDPTAPPKPINDIALTPEEEAVPLGPSVEVYDLILHGISRSSNEKIDHPRAWNLILDMKTRGIHFPNVAVVAHVKRFMTKATNHKEAFDMYNRFIDLHPQSMTEDEDAFLTIIRQFIFSEWVKSPAPSYDLVGNFINDARRSGFDPSHRVMTTLFSQYARVSYTDGGMLDDEVEEYQKRQPIMKKNVRGALAWCRIDPYIQMDRVIYNAIMIAAARTGVFKEAYATWLIVSESTDPFVAADNESVNIIFDAIRLHATSNMAQHLFRWLRNGEFPLTLQNYHAYLRCLLGCGDPDRATQLVLLEMRQQTGSPPAPLPTPSTVRTILQYQSSYGENLKKRMRTVVKREFPEWWEEYGWEDGERVTRGKLDEAREELEEGRGMVDLLPEPEEGDEGEMWARKTREGFEERSRRERFRSEVEKALKPKPTVVHVY